MKIGNSLYIIGILIFAAGVGLLACKGKEAEAPEPGVQAQIEGGVSMKIEKQSFGKLADGTAVELYTLTNAKGTRIRVMNWGSSSKR